MTVDRFIRLVPERPTVAFTAEEAIDSARAAFGEAKFGGVS